MKHTPATESKVDNGQSPYLHPYLRSLDHFAKGKPGWDMRARSITLRALTLTLTFASTAFSGGNLPPENRTFRHPNLSTKDLRDLLIDYFSIFHSLCYTTLNDFVKHE